MNRLTALVGIASLGLASSGAQAYNFITADCGNINFSGGNMTFNYGSNLFEEEKTELTIAAARLTMFSTATITIGNENDSSFANDNDQNEVFFDSSVGTARCWYRFNTGSCNVIEADVQMGDEPWTTGQDSEHWPFDWSASGGRSVLGTAVHEWGHCVGMAHENSMYNMMGSDWTHVTRNAETTYYGPGEDLSNGLIALHGERTGGDDTFRDVGATVFRYDSADGEYSDHRFGVLRDASTGSTLPVVGSFSGQNTFQVVAGETVEMELTLENNGEENTENPNVGYYLSTNSTISSSDVLLRALNNYTLGRNTPYEIEVDVTIPVDTAPGNYFLGAFVDHENLITEVTGTNNIAYYPITVLAAPSDLIVPFAGVNDSTLRPGEAFSAVAIVRNDGDGQSDPTTLRYYRSINSIISTSDTQIGTDGITGLNAGQTQGANDPNIAPSAEGIWWIGACIDSVARESNTSNNCSSGAQITVAVVEPSVTTDSVNVLSVTTVNFRATINPNGGDTTVYFDYGTDNQFDTTITQAGVYSGLADTSIINGTDNLDCDTTYQVRARAVNSAGETVGNTQEFTTPSCGLFNDRFEATP